jgi:ubiquitin C-terminal hydrolase
MKIPVFPNLGNTCYLSCVLQSLLHSKGFKENLSGLDTPLAQELIKISDLIDNNIDNKYNAVLYNIKDLLNILPFAKFEQQDAHECILYFLDKLDDSNLVKLFHGTTETCFHCLKCATKKMVSEPFNSINLTVPDKSSELVELFHKYLQPEQFLEHDLYFCETCNELTQYEKKLSLSLLPDVLIVVLKRYTFTGAKLESDVHFGNELNIREQSSGIIKQYRLKSVINHFGNLFNGHYTNFLHENLWLFIDDERVKPRNCVIDNAYILFYEIK